MPLAAGARIVGVAVLGLLAGARPAAGQVAWGEIYGRVTDATGAILPGVAVTVTSPALLQPRSAVTTKTGTYRFPLIPIGTYTARFELAGFRRLVREGIRIEIGLSARIDAELSLGGVQEVVEVSGASPLIDLKDAGKNNRFTREALQAIPSARDPWAIIEQSAGVAMDRQNVGGSSSGQQGNHVVRGTVRESKWSLDGVDITDMVATGSSPVYYDFDAFEEIQVTTAGADVAMQSSGLAINLVTKSGTDRIRGSGRYYITDEALESNNVTGELRRLGVYTGNPIENIKDYGVEAGGPIRKGRAWVWGGYGTQRIDVGVNNFYKRDARCQAMKAAPLDYSLENIQTCLVTDTTTLETYNLKFAVRTMQNNELSFLFNAAEKTKPTREASDLRPFETTLRQGSVTRPDLGSRWWTTGIPKTYRWSARHVFGDRFVVEGQYAHVGNNYAVTFQDETLRRVQPAVDTPAGTWSRSYSEDINVRPANIVEATGSYLLPGVLHGDHALKFGFKWRNDVAYRETNWGGNAVAVFFNGKPAYAQLYRPSRGEYGLHNRSFYLQDSYTQGRVTINAGFRFDYQHDYVNPASLPASPFDGQPTYTGKPFDRLPAIDFGGCDPKVAFKTFSPRAGVSVDLTGSGRTVLKALYARYAGQLGGGSAPIAMAYVPGSSVRYPWADLNRDGFIEAREIVLTDVPASWAPGYDYNNPSRAAGTAASWLSADRTNEVVVSVERFLAREIVVTASYIWRRYDNARWNDVTGWTSADYVAKAYPLSPRDCPPGARCEPVTYWEPVRAIPVRYALANQPDFWRGYHGYELTARKRLGNGSMLNASFSYNDARVHYGSPRAYEDPTNIDRLNNAQYAPQYAQDSASAAPGNVFVNAKWIFRVAGSWRTPLVGIDVGGFYDSRSGYPLVASIQTPSRALGAGIGTVYLDKLGDKRLSAVRTLDLRINRAFTVRRMKLVPAVDVFNLLNANTALSIRAVQNAANANRVSSILPPRVIRVGLRAEW